ncbi:hypothetical protein M569_00589, partial [Genlisea aurea]
GLKERITLLPLNYTRYNIILLCNRTLCRTSRITKESSKSVCCIFLRGNKRKFNQIRERCFINFQVNTLVSY